ncbi:hypothetical protein [Cupriavidus sp. TMH.W2]|uniref:hypothetical protein n=1 Tax=Cupriavidus sp. TMH.W2 TaxID=3434465 RepID=UPI003D7770A7
MSALVTAVVIMGALVGYLALRVGRRFGRDVAAAKMMILLAAEARIGQAGRMSRTSQVLKW